MKVKTERVYSDLDDKIVTARRFGEKVLILAGSRVVDSDRSILTDRRGFRYARNIPAEVVGLYGGGKIYQQI